MKPNRAVGFVLIDAMITVAPVALAFPLAFSLIRVTLRADRGFADCQGSATRFDGAMTALRKDIWNAAILNTAGNHQLTIGQGKAETIQWKVTTDGKLKREVIGESPRTWALDHPLLFKVEGPTVSVSSPRDLDGRGVAMTFLSQPLIAQKGGS